MSRRNLAKATSVLTLAANQNLGRLKARGIRTPASTYIKQHGGKFKSAAELEKMSLEEIREEFQRAKDYLNTKTGSVAGFREWEKSMSDTLFRNTSVYEKYVDENGVERERLVTAGIDYNQLTEREKRKFWKAFSKLEELDSANVYGARYRVSVNEIYTAVKGGLRFKDIDEFVKDMNSKIYEEQAAHFFDESENPFSLLESENPFKDEGG